MKGWKVAAVVSWPSRVSSTKPMTAASEVFLISWTRKPTVGGIATRMRLRHDDVAQLLGEAEAERGAGLPLRGAGSPAGAAPDLAEEGAGIDREGGRRGDPGRDREAEDRQAEEEHEQPGEQRRALDDLDVDRRRSSAAARRARRAAAR